MSGQEQMHLIKISYIGYNQSNKFISIYSTEHIESKIRSGCVEFRKTRPKLLEKCTAHVLDVDDHHYKLIWFVLNATSATF